MLRGFKEYSRHIDKLIEKQMSKELENNRLRLKTLIECARWLAFQACTFRGYDESLDSKNRGNFIELIKFTSTFNDKVANVVLEMLQEMLQEMPNIHYPQFKRRFCIFLLVMCEMLFVRKLGIKILHSC